MYNVVYRSTFKDERKEVAVDAVSEIAAIPKARKMRNDIEYVVSVTKMQ